MIHLGFQVWEVFLKEFWRLGLDKFLKMESSGSMRVEKRGYEEGVELDDDAEEGHQPEPKKQRLPALARFLFPILIFGFYDLFLLIKG